MLVAGYGRRFGQPVVGRPAWLLAGVLLVVGTVTAIAAMATGMVELLKVDGDHPATRDLNRHMLLAMAAWGLYAASLLLRLRGSRWQGPIRSAWA